MGQSPSTASHRHDNASTRTLHSTSIHSNRQVSFFKRISQRIHPTRRFGRQNRAATQPTSNPAAINTSNRPSARRNAAHNRQGSSILINSGSSTTSSVRRATQEAARAAAAVTGPPTLPNFLQYLQQIQDHSSTRNSVISAESINTGFSNYLMDMPNLRVQPNEGGIENEQQQQQINRPLLRYLQLPPRENETNNSRTTVASSGASTTTTNSRRMHLLVVEYRQGQNQTPLSDNISARSVSSSQPPRAPVLGRRLLGLRRPRSEVSTTSSTETLQSMPLSMHTTAGNQTSQEGGGQWVVYVLNGQNTLPAMSSPLIDDSATYEDLLMLGNMLGSVRPNTTTQAAIDETIPVIDWSDGTKKELKDDQCLVCLDEFNLKQSVRVLKCNHVFHKECVDKWLCESHNSCPVCRRIPV